MSDVAKRYAQGRGDGHRFLLVCQDLWDLESRDLGYYYRSTDDEMYVRAQLETFLLSADDGRMADRCHAVIPLYQDGADKFNEELCIAPAVWLKANSEE